MTAVISSCGLYRYRLERDVAMAGPVYAFFGVNPSTADASIDDATVRKWTGFVKRWGGSRYLVGNVFAYRATDVRELVNDPGPAFSLANQGHLRDIAAAADVLVPCWGARSKVPRDLHHIIDALEYAHDGEIQRIVQIRHLLADAVHRQRILDDIIGAH